MKCERILVVGVARNCGKTILNEYARISNALHHVPLVKYLLIESDSGDDTVSKLKFIKENDGNFEYRTLGKLRKTFPYPTARIARCRNAYLEEVQRNPAYADIQYILVADFDGINTLLTAQGIKSCWHFDSWDVCTANQLGLYYDMYALRHPILCPSDWKEKWRYLNNVLGVPCFAAKKIALHSQMFSIPTNSDPIQVDSAFGGLALYKRETLENVRYEGVDGQGKEICEHVTLHRQITNKGFSIYINPRLINCKPPPVHTKVFKFRSLVSCLVNKNYFPKSIKMKLLAHFS